MHNTTYEESISAINLVETVMSGPATSTPSRESGFEGFRRELDISAHHGNQIYFESRYDETSNNMIEVEELYNSHFEEEEVQVKSVVRKVQKVQKDYSTQTDLHNLSRDSIDLEWDDL